MNKKKEVVITKKVKPYPITAQAVSAGETTGVPVQILRVAPGGCIVDTDDAKWMINDEFSISFELPVIKERVSGKVRVIKTYDRYKAPNSELQATGSDSAKPEPSENSNPVPGKQHLAEVLFLSLDPGMLPAIKRFMRKIGQGE